MKKIYILSLMFSALLLFSSCSNQAIIDAPTLEVNSKESTTEPTDEDADIGVIEDETIGAVEIQYADGELLESYFQWAYSKIHNADGTLISGWLNDDATDDEVLEMELMLLGTISSTTDDVYDPNRPLPENYSSLYESWRAKQPKPVEATKPAEAAKPAQQQTSNDNTGRQSQQNSNTPNNVEQSQPQQSEQPSNPPSSNSMQNQSSSTQTWGGFPSYEAYIDHKYEYYQGTVSREELMKTYPDLSTWQTVADDPTAEHWSQG